MSVTIKFLGAAGTVTGSKYLVESENKKILIDAGMFQGKKKWRERNWHDPEVDLADIDAVLLTHGDGDHIGGIEKFTNAKFYIPKKAFELWTSEKDFSTHSRRYFTSSSV